METAKEIANKSPDAVRAAKRLLNDAVAVDAATGLMAESVEQQKLIGSPNQLEAIMSNLQKRAANYKDPTSPSHVRFQGEKASGIAPRRG